MVTTTPTATNTPTNTPTNIPTNTPTPTNTPAPRPVAAEDNSPLVQYNGWRGIVDASANGGAYRISTTKNNKLTFGFKGTAVTWLTRIGPAGGLARVQIDGVTKCTCDLYSPGVIPNAAFSFSSLTSSSHMIVIIVLGTKGASSTGFNVAVDGWVVGGITTQETAMGVKFDTWRGVANSNASGGTYHTSTTADAFAQFNFVGGGKVDWLTAAGPRHGQTDINFDGKYLGTIDLYYPQQMWKACVQIYNIPAGKHSLRIRVRGTKNANSTGTSVVIDRFYDHTRVPPVRSNSYRSMRRRLPLLYSF